MDKNIYPYPCTECKNKKGCYLMCTAYKEWFREEWRIVTAPFIAIRLEREERNNK